MPGLYSNLKIIFCVFSTVLSINIQNSHAQTVIQSKQEKFQITKITDGLVHPWALAFLPNKDILITERPGRLRIVRNNKLEPQPISGLPPIAAGGQGGLLDIIIHPDFEKNKLIYFAYASQNRAKFGTQVARAKLEGNKISDLKVIFKASPKTGNRFHYGSRLLFDAAKNLYITIGEKFQMQQAQDLSNHLGTVIRIKDDGTLPLDNPFIKQNNKKPEIFTYGHRNPQGIAQHPKTKAIWIHEHGPQGGDEINILKPGANYGWPKVTYGRNYDDTIISRVTKAPGMEQPILHWTPSIAPSGMAFYTGNKFPNWKGNLFVGSLKFLHLRRLELSNNKVVDQEVLLQSLSERIRDIRTGPDGYIYILTDSRNGQLIRLEPVAP